MLMKLIHRISMTLVILNSSVIPLNDCLKQFSLKVKCINITTELVKYNS